MQSPMIATLNLFSYFFFFFEKYKKSLGILIPVDNYRNNIKKKKRQRSCPSPLEGFSSFLTVDQSKLSAPKLNAFHKRKKE